VGIGTTAPTANITIDKGLGGSTHTTFTTANSYLQLGVSDYNSSGGVYAIGFGYSGGATHSPAYIGLQQTETGSYTKGDLVFRTRSTSTDVEPPERMRISSSGNVGINQSSPAFALCISDDSNPNRNGMEIAIGTSDTSGNTIQNYNRATSAYTPLNIAGSTLTFGAGTNATERARIDSSGNLLVGKTSTGFVNSNNWAVEGASVVQGHVSSLGGGSTYTYFVHGGSSIGSISQNGTTGIFYNTSSDQRLKENIADADDAGSKIDAIQVRKYDWKADGSHQDYGMIAQELVEVAPEAVSGDADSEEMMGVDYSKLVPMLIKEIQSLRNRVATLEE
jgi:hypothetical protein